MDRVDADAVSDNLCSQLLAEIGKCPTNGPIVHSSHPYQACSHSADDNDAAPLVLPHMWQRFSRAADCTEELEVHVRNPFLIRDRVECATLLRQHVCATNENICPTVMRRGTVHKGPAAIQRA